MTQIETNPPCVRQLWFIQASLLAGLAMTFSGSRYLLEAAEISRNMTVVGSRRNHVFQAGNTQLHRELLSSDHNLDQHWLQWVETEGKKRYGYCSFVNPNKSG